MPERTAVTVIVTSKEAKLIADALSGVRVDEVNSVQDASGNAVDVARAMKRTKVLHEVAEEFRKSVVDPAKK